VPLSGGDALRITVDPRRHGHTVISVCLVVQRWDKQAVNTPGFAIEPCDLRAVQRALGALADRLGMPEHA